MGKPFLRAAFPAGRIIFRGKLLENFKREYLSASTSEDLDAR